MSARNGDKSRYQINRKRRVLRRARIRQLLGTAPAKRRAKPPTGKNA
jgi:hypothetical protein